MTQDERWLAQWKQIMDFMEANRRRPSKFQAEERGMRNWLKHQQKLMNAEALKVERVERKIIPKTIIYDMSKEG